MATICGSCGALLGSGTFSLSTACFRPSIQHIQGRLAVVTVRAEDKDKFSSAEEPKESKQSPFTAFTDALDFASVRSAEDAELLEEARAATKGGEQMTREQYGALRRKIGGTYRDFFKDFVEVDGDYVDEGWVDKTCRYCKKSTSGSHRTVDKLGRYAHVECQDNQKSGNFFTRLFSK